MSKKKTPEEIVKVLDAVTRVVAQGGTVADGCRQVGVHEQTYYRWKRQYAGMTTSEARKFKELQRENALLKKLLAEADLEKAVLKELAEGNF